VSNVTGPWLVPTKTPQPAEIEEDRRAAGHAQGRSGVRPADLATATTVALEGDEVCGFATTGQPGSRADVWRLSAIYVDPRAWGGSRAGEGGVVDAGCEHLGGGEREELAAIIGRL
jgi:hypothetical protein